MTLPVVSVGLVTWNSARHLRNSLESLSRQSYPATELVVVDNGSTDESLNLASASFPTARLIANPGNRGFCGGHNQAIRASQGSYYLALNPDIVLEQDYLAALVEALEARPECGSAAGKIRLVEDGHKSQLLDSTGLFINRRRQQYLRGHGECDTRQYDHLRNVFGVDGAAPLYRRTMLDETSFEGEYFDEAFFAYKEDVDLAWRSRLYGWESYYVPEAEAYHPRTFRPGFRKPASTLARVHSVKNRYLLILKNDSGYGLRRDWLPVLWYDLQIISYLLIVEWKSLRAFALLQQSIRRALQWRRHIWSRARLKPQDTVSWFL